MLSSHLVDVYSPLFNLMTSRLIPCATLAPAIPAVRCARDEGRRRDGRLRFHHSVRAAAMVDDVALEANSPETRW